MKLREFATSDLALTIYLALVLIAWSWCLDAVLVHASPLECESIQDVDRRHYCRAVTVPSKAECEFIKNVDLRHLCRVMTR